MEKIRISFSQSANGAWWYHIGSMYSVGSYSTKIEAMRAFERSLATHR